MTTKTGLALLREPFPVDQIGKLPKPYKADNPKGNCNQCGGYHGLPAAHLDFVGHADLTARLLDADPHWTWEPFATDDQGLPAFDRQGNLWIRLTVCSVTRVGVGDGKSVKECIGDALRNAAMRFGAALDLWAKGDRDYAAGDQQERPASYADALDAVRSLSDERRDTVRTQLQSIGINPSPALWSEDDCQAVIAACAA